MPAGLPHEIRSSGMFLYMWEMWHYKINGHVLCGDFEEVFGVMRDYVLFYG
jgi:hypothetical protein